MKCLLLIRHAKSSWDNPFQKDFDRPLNDRGKKDAPKMAKRLSERNIPIDCFVSSPARRAFETCSYFIKAFDEKEKEIVVRPELYLPTADAFYAVIEKLEDDCSNVAIFSHNPGITNFVNELTNVHVDEMPTCGIYAIKVKLKSWKDFRSSEKKFWFFDYPKKDS